MVDGNLETQFVSSFVTALQFVGTIRTDFVSYKFAAALQGILGTERVSHNVQVSAYHRRCVGSHTHE